MPIEYKNTSLIHAWQWAIGLEWYLLVEDPWRVVMSTDHPNGGSFLAYPQIIRLLMDRTYRQDMLKTVPAQGARAKRAGRPRPRSTRLSEIAIITRAGPARILGLKHKGHLGPGADADITIYTPDANQETMFELPRFVIKAGRDHRRTGRNPRGNLRQDAARRPRLRPRRRDRHRALVRESPIRSSGGTTPSMPSRSPSMRWLPERSPMPGPTWRAQSVVVRNRKASGRRAGQIRGQNRLGCHGTATEFRKPRSRVAARPGRPPPPS